jgi:dihydrodipicolinate synthase/N-acetylneuraminate lyase
LRVSDVRHWGGIYPSLPTPFDSSGDVDLEAMRRVVRFALSAGSDGLVCSGLAGEVGRLTTSERMRLCEAIVQEADGAVPVLVGATAENLAQSRSLAEHAERTGASGLVLPPPTGYHVSTAHITDFFVGVAECTALPVIVQDAPEYLSVTVGPAAVLAAAERAATICGVKLETGAEGIEAWRGALGESFRIFGGNGGLFLLDCLRAGAAGIMPGADTVDLQVAIARAEREGRPREADEGFRRLLPMLVFEMTTIDHYNACAKHVLRQRGVIETVDLRLPGPRRLTATSVERLEAYLESIGIASVTDGIPAT